MSTTMKPKKAVDWNEAAALGWTGTRRRAKASAKGAVFTLDRFKTRLKGKVADLWRLVVTGAVKFQGRYVHRQHATRTAKKIMARLGRKKR
jgi:transposase-like protein